MFTIGRAKKRVLGISVGERTALVAEVASNGQPAQITRVARFAFPAGVSLEEPAALGAALAAFLRDNGFHARHVVFGVPAKWLLCKAQSVPPADEATANSMLSLRAEAEAAPELGEMVFDYAGQVSPSAPTSVLLLGVPRRWTDRLTATAGAAGLHTVGITPASAALAAVTPDNIELVLSIRTSGSELIGRDGRQFRFARHLGGGISTPMLISELRRATTMLAAGASSDVLLWDDIGLDAGAIDEIRAALGTSVTRGQLGTLGAVAPGTAADGIGASAVALALPILSGVRPAVNFLRPRLIKPRATNIRRRMAYAAAAIILLVGLAAYIDLSGIQRQLARADADLLTITPAVKVATPFVNSMQFAESYQGAKPRYLACVSDLTQALPEDGQTYLTSLHLDTAMKGDFAGRSNNHQEVLNLLERLHATGRFAELKRKLDGRGSGPEVMFSVTFKYLPAR